MKNGIEEYLKDRYDAYNVELDKGMINVRCPHCEKVNSFPATSMDGMKASDLIISMGHVHTCDHCGELMKLTTVYFEWYQTFALAPPAPGQTYLQYEWPERNAPLVCSHCGLEADNLFHVEISPSTYIGPMCTKCMDIHYDSILELRGKSEIRTIPFYTLQNYPVLYFAHEKLRARCPHCLRTYAPPLDIIEKLSQEPDEGKDRDYITCPICGEIHIIALSRLSTTVWTQEYGDH